MSGVDSFGPGAMNPLSLCQGDESSLVMFKIKQSRNIQSGELTKMYILGDKFPLFLYAGAMNPLSLFRCVLIWSFVILDTESGELHVSVKNPEAAGPTRDL